MSYSSRNWANTDEEKARQRRLKLFLRSGLNEIYVVRNEHGVFSSPKHDRICQIIAKETNGTLDHLSFWTCGHTHVLLTEAYFNNTPECYQHDLLYAREVPLEVSPYCGRWNPEGGALPWTQSVLVTTSLKRQQLDRVLENLHKIAALSPPWNHLGGDK